MCLNRASVVLRRKGGNIFSTKDSSLNLSCAKVRETLQEQFGQSSGVKCEAWGDRIKTRGTSHRFPMSEKTNNLPQGRLFVTPVRQKFCKLHLTALTVRTSESIVYAQFNFFPLIPIRRAPPFGGACSWHTALGRAKCSERTRRTG